MRWVAAATVLLPLLLAACGTPGGLPDPPTCPDDDPRLNDPAVGIVDYAEAVISTFDRLQVVDQDFRREWSERRLRGRSSFRADFVTFATHTRCLVDDIRGSAVPDQAADLLGRDLLNYLDFVDASIDQGEEAVDTRNASAYRDWIRDFDQLVVGYTDFQGRLGQLAPR